MQLNSEQYKNIYPELGISLDELGCLMLDVRMEIVPKIDSSYLYQAKDEKKFWIKGLVAEKTPHITLLYGFLKPAYEYKKQIETVLKGWDIGSVQISSIGYFPSPYLEEPYSCIVAHLKVTQELMEGHQRCQLLPHVDTYPEFKPHITIAYVKDDSDIRTEVINTCHKQLTGYNLQVIGLNYGKNTKA